MCFPAENSSLFSSFPRSIYQNLNTEIYEEPKRKERECMLGAIIGDIIGSPYEFESFKTTNFELFNDGCTPTDDSIMTVAVGCACVLADIEDEWEFKAHVIYYMRKLGNLYPDAGYGDSFWQWLQDKNMGPYGSYGNGSAMRVSPVAWVADSLEQAETLAQWSAEVTHNHAEGIKGAQAVAAAIWLARDGKDKDGIREYIEEKYYDLDFTIDEIRAGYSFDVTCQGSVPQAIKCFLEAGSYEEAVRLAVSLGGDGDTQAAIAGSIAEAYFGIPEEIAEKGMEYLEGALYDYYMEYSEQLYK